MDVSPLDGKSHGRDPGCGGHHHRGPGFGHDIVGADYVGDKIDICTSTSVDCGNGRRSDWWT